MSDRLEIETRSASAAAAGRGFCDGCGAEWRRGPYCPSCGVLALDSHLGRCPDCGLLTEYVNGAWRHEDPSAECFLLQPWGDR